MQIYIKKLAWLSLFLWFYSLSAMAEQDLSSLLNGIKSMRARFQQTIYDNNGNAVQQSSGSMALARPGKFRWEVTKPMPQTIIANAEKLWIYDPDLQQVTIRSLKSEASEAPALLLSHQNSDLEKNYQIKTLAPDGSLRWFLLKPKGNDNMFISVKMGFAGAQLKEMVLEDHIGHATKVKFINIKINEPIPSSLFVLKTPAGTDVIDETH